VGLVWSKDPESCAGSSLVTGRASLAGQVESDDPDENGYSGPPGCGLGVGLTTSPRKKVDVEKISEIPQKGLIKNKRSGYKKKDLTFGTWNVPQLFKNGTLLSLLSQLKQDEKTSTGEAHHRS